MPNSVAYNGQIPGPLFRMREGEPQSVEIRNLTKDSEVVHWHGLYLPPEIDGAMEEGTPMITIYLYSAEVSALHSRSSCLYDDHLRVTFSSKSNSKK